jgi:hypothetical protein
VDTIAQRERFPIYDEETVHTRDEPGSISELVLPAGRITGAAGLYVPILAYLALIGLEDAIPAERTHEVEGGRAGVITELGTIGIPVGAIRRSLVAGVAVVTCLSLLSHAVDDSVATRVAFARGEAVILVTGVSIIALLSRLRVDDAIPAAIDSAVGVAGG